jgi:glycosyltransferase involved in cell wall biosynthesis
MRILWINHRDPKHPEAGGAEVHIAEVGKRLVRKGHEITLLCERFKGSKPEEELYAMKVKRFGGRFMLHCYAPYFVKRNSGDFDIIIDDVAHAVPFWSPKFTRKPVVAIVHHVHQNVLKFEVGSLQAMVLRTLEKGIKNYGKIIAVSNTARRDLLKLGVDEKEIRVIYNGVDHEKYRPGEKSRKPMILWIGRMKRYKNPFDSLRIYKRLTKKAEMVVVGDGDLAKDFARISERMGVKYLGKVTEEEKVKLYQRAWLVLSTSYIEGWGMTAVEANSCGTPVVAYATGSMPEIIQEGVNGFLVPYKDYDYAAKVIDTILEEGTIAELSKKSLEESMKYSWKKTADEYMRYLSKI